MPWRRLNPPFTGLISEAWIKRVLSSDLSLRCPSHCWVCGSWPSAPLCEPCITAFAQPEWRCTRCALVLPRGSAIRVGARGCSSCQNRESPLTACYAALDYAYPWDRCIASFKYGQQPGMAHALARLMWHAPGIAPALEQAERVVPMPLSRERMQQRGYNQAHELGRALARRLSSTPTTPQGETRYSPHVLHRVRDTQAQSTLDASARAANLQDACVVLPSDGAEIQGRRIVVIDDIMTTGASLREAARALLQAGAGSVTAVVLARTPAVS